MQRKTVDLKDGDNYLMLFGNYSKEAVDVQNDIFFADGVCCISEIVFSYDETLFNRGEFIAVKKTSGLDFFSGEKIEIIAHNLPIGIGVPSGWEIINGRVETCFDGFQEKETWKFFSVVDRVGVSFEEVVEYLRLQEMKHPYGKIWLKNDMPVAVSGKKVWKKKQNGYFFQEVIFGKKDFFISDDFFLLKSIYRNGQKVNHQLTSQNEDQKNIKLGINKLYNRNWYPISVRDEYVLWAINMFLFPKNFCWRVGYRIKSNKKGGCIYDSSIDRLERVRRFFKEKISIDSISPDDEYAQMASEADPHFGIWKTKKDYPKKYWKPDFPGWRIDDLQAEIECRWKKPKTGTTGYYGVIR